MDDEQKPDPVLLGLISRTQAKNGLNRSPSFSNWMNKGSTISHTRTEDEIGQNLAKNAKTGSTNMLNPCPVPSFNNWMDKGSISHTRPDNLQIPKNSMKNEAWSWSWSCSSKVANPGSLVSASNSRIATNKEPAKAQVLKKKPSASNARVVTNKEPAKVAFSLKNQELDSKARAAKSATNDQEQVKLMLKGSTTPTRPRSGLKRAARDYAELHPSKDNKIKKTVETLFCELCQISCSGPIVMQQHLIGRQHKAKMEYRKLKTTNGDMRAKPMCDVCKIWCPDRDALEMHFKGQKHKAKVKEVEACRKNGEKGKSSVIMCELCHVPCMNEDAYQMHLKGKQHAWEEIKRKQIIPY